MLLGGLPHKYISMKHCIKSKTYISADRKHHKLEGREYERVLRVSIALHNHLSLFANLYPRGSQSKVVLALRPEIQTRPYD